MNTLEQIEKFQKKALIEGEDEHTATTRNLGYHIEEFVEMLQELTASSGVGDNLLSVTIADLTVLSRHAKAGTLRYTIKNREKFLDALADQVVTLTAVAVNADMQLANAVAEVQHSNMTKLVNGEFQRDTNGKITKPATYLPPDLKGLY